MARCESCLRAGLGPACGYDSSPPVTPSGRLHSSLLLFFSNFLVTKKSNFSVLSFYSTKFSSSTPAALSSPVFSPLVLTTSSTLMHSTLPIPCYFFLLFLQNSNPTQILPSKLISTLPKFSLLDPQLLSLS